MRPFLFSCLAMAFMSLAVYSIYSFYSLGSFGAFGSAVSGRVASSQSNYPVASIGEVFRNF
ncbi:hypothetical protein C1884_00230 [Pseudomonas sp. GW460-R15]|nr:hypothetical protein C1887_23230 [Pseudomonas sp. GW456-R21]POA71572.1 hypothetical protein C1884_00230 [Pseudomonas sp. GW460-R15]